MMKIPKSFLFGGFALATLVPPRTASADDLHECAAAYEQTQRFQQKNELVSALEAAERCSKPTCPALLTSECTKWTTDIKSKLPKLVLHVRGGDGCALNQAQVETDSPTRRGDGAALLIDPGTHEVNVVDPSTNQSRKQTMNFGPGEKRDIDVDFAPPGAVCPRPSQSTPIGQVPTVSLITGTVGAGFVIAGAVLGIVGASKRGDLDECKPHCGDDRVDAVRPFFVAGDVLAAIGVVSIAVGAISYFVLKRPSHETHQTQTGTTWHFGPNGAGATF